MAENYFTPGLDDYHYWTGRREKKLNRFFFGFSIVINSFGNNKRENVSLRETSENYRFEA
jgi:hypothetical protein